MRRLVLTILKAFLAGSFLCAALAPPGVAQANAASPANSSGQNAEPATQASVPAPAQPAAKKVWTNDDVIGLREDSKISTFTQPHANPAKSTGRPANPKAKDTKWYQDRIAGLRAKLPPLDDQIGQLQAALSGQTVNSVRKWGGVKPDDWRVELDELQKKHDSIEAQISALEDQARRDGIPAGALP
ncbi:MAG: hypothetical protein WA581_17340 [Candidatus Acidiferrales bacterium]